MRPRILRIRLNGAPGAALLLALSALPAHALEANPAALGAAAAPLDLHQGQSAAKAPEKISHKSSRPAAPHPRAHDVAAKLAPPTPPAVAKKSPLANMAALAEVRKLPLVPAEDPEAVGPGAGAPELRGAPADPITAPPAPEPTAAPPALAAPSATPEAAVPALEPLKAAVKAALEARGRLDQDHPPGAEQRKEHEAVAAFYAARDFAPLWSHDGAINPEVKPALERLARSAEDGLAVKPPAFSASGAEDAVANADIALSDAVVAYARQASGARVDPRAISPLIAARPAVADPSVVLAVVSIAGAGAGEALKAFNPPQKEYEALRQKLAEARRTPPVVARAIPAGRTLKVGMRDPRVPLIRARLSLDGRSDEAKDLVYDTRVASAVADFQKANGLPGSGQLNARTTALLSGGAGPQAEAEIIANMERWRWMPRDMGDSRIEVNIPDFEAVVVENGEVVQRNRVVVGKEETPTPVFSNTMQFLIVNPYWNVPPSIIRKEMMPKLAADPHYLHRLGYETTWRDGRLTVRQPPGERNALGRIKFMFPNDYAVYLHDTPLRTLFASEKRAFSHGCVRVDDPFRFAQTVLGKGWTEARVEKLVGGKERYVHLAKPLPIHLEYFTARVDEFGRLQLRDDLYGYSRKVKAALGLPG